MKEMNGKQKCLAVLLAAGFLAVQCAAPLPAGSPLAPVSASAFTAWSIQEISSVELAPGLAQRQFSYTINGNTTQCFEYSLDPKDDRVSLRVTMPGDGTDYGLDTVRDMANSAIVNGKDVVAAVNGDMYNMSTGEPWGVVYQDGKLVHNYNAAGRNWLFVGFTKDGELVYGDQSVYEQTWPQLDQALGLHSVLAEGGRNVCTDTSSTRAPRTAVGLRADGTVFFLVADGRQSSSGGLSLSELADLMIKEGAQWAGNLDGGGGSTAVSRLPGETKLTVRNSPSDGSERNVANSIVFLTSGSPSSQVVQAAKESLYGTVKSDTTLPVTIRQGESYQFRMTLVEGSNPPVCYTDNTSAFTVTYTGNQGRDYFYKVTATGAPGASGEIYTKVPNMEGVRQCTVVVG